MQWNHDSKYDAKYDSKSCKQILTQNDFIYVIYKEVQKLVCILLHVIIKFLWKQKKIL